MHEVTRLLDLIAGGDPHAVGELLPLVYEELRQLAAARMLHEAPGQTLQPTALVHEAYLRLVASGDGSTPHDINWNSRGHFFAAAAEAMRRILIEQARRKGRVRHGGQHQRIALDDASPIIEPPEEDLLALDEALTRLAERDHIKAELVKLRFFAGLTMPDAAAALGISLATAERYWVFARTWLYAELSGDGPDVGEKKSAPS